MAASLNDPVDPAREIDPILALSTQAILNTWKVPMLIKIIAFRSVESPTVAYPDHPVLCKVALTKNIKI